MRFRGIAIVLITVAAAHAGMSEVSAQQEGPDSHGRVALDRLVDPDVGVVVFSYDEVPPAPGIDEPSRGNLPNETTTDRTIRELNARIQKLEQTMNAQARQLGGVVKDQNKVKDDKAKETRSKAAKPTVGWTAELQNDSVWADQSEANRAAVGDIKNGNDFRRIRIAMIGDFLEVYDYRMEVDFAQQGRPQILDTYLGHKDVPILGGVRVGNFFEPFLLDRVTSNRYGEFMERSLTDAFAPARNVGIMTYNFNDERKLMWQVGAFHTNSDVYADSLGDNREWSFDQRLAWAPGFDPEHSEYLHHFGIAHSFRYADDRTVRFRSNPEMRDNQEGVASMPYFVDTRHIPTNYYDMVGFEYAMVHKSLSIQSEYVMVNVNRIDNSPVFFQSGYAFISWFITGEHREYNYSTSNHKKPTGTFDRIKTNTVVLPPMGSDTPRGIGAIELAARYSFMDLSDDTVRGGVLQDVTLGVNWYLNPYTRVMVNYVHPILNKDGFGITQANLTGLRFQYDF